MLAIVSSKHIGEQAFICLLLSLPRHPTPLPRRHWLPALVQHGPLPQALCFGLPLQRVQVHMLAGVPGEHHRLAVAHHPCPGVLLLALHIRHHAPVTVRGARGDPAVLELCRRHAHTP